jgi:hypothetical protein
MGNLHLDRSGVRIVVQTFCNSPFVSVVNQYDMSYPTNSTNKNDAIYRSIANYDISLKKLHAFARLSDVLRLHFFSLLVRARAYGARARFLLLFTFFAIFLRRKKIAKKVNNNNVERAAKPRKL